MTIKGCQLQLCYLKKRLKKRRFFELLSKAKMKMVVSESTFLFLDLNEQKVKYQLMHNFWATLNEWQFYRILLTISRNTKMLTKRQTTVIPWYLMLFQYFVWVNTIYWDVLWSWYRTKIVLFELWPIRCEGL